MTAALQRRLRRAYLRLTPLGMRSIVAEPAAHLLQRFCLNGNASPHWDALDRRFSERAKEIDWQFPERISTAAQWPDAELFRRADALLSGRFDFGVEGVQNPGQPIDWRFDPTNDPRRRWARELNRWEWLPTLVEAFERSGDERYAQQFVDLLDHWIDSNPPPLDRDETHICWNLMNVGLRSIVLSIAFFRYYGAKAFDVHAKQRMLRTLFDHAQYLRRFRTHSNHLLREANGLAYLGYAFPEFRSAAGWRDVALQRLATELHNQLNDDGSHVEMSVAYQWLVIEEFEATAALLRQFGGSLPGPDLTASLQRMYEFLQHMQNPDGTWPQLSDGFFAPWPDLHERLRQAIGRGEAVPVKANPPPTQQVFPRAGIGLQHAAASVSRLLFRAGPYGGVHGHEDALALELCVNGAPLFVDPGTYTYNAADPWRSHFVSSAAHNTVTPGSLSQVRRWQARHRSAGRHEPAMLEAGQAGRLHWLQGTYTDGYGEFAFYPPPVVDRHIDRSLLHRRTVLFVDLRYWLIIDDLVATEPQSWSRRWQCAAGTRVAALGAGYICCAPNQAALWMVGAGDASTVTVVHEGVEQPAAGWVSNGQRLHREAAPQIEMTTRLAAGGRLITLMWPMEYPADSNSIESGTLPELFFDAETAVCRVRSKLGEHRLSVDRVLANHPVDAASAAPQLETIS